MLKKILIINSKFNGHKFLLAILEQLSQMNFNFFLLSAQPNLIDQFRKKNWPAKKIFLGPNLKNNFSLIIFIILYPFLFLLYFFILIYYKYSKKINALFLLNWNEKIIFTPLAAILGIKPIWLEPTDFFYFKIPKLAQKFYKFFSGFSQIIVFNSFIKIQQINLGIKEKNIKIIPPGVKYNQYQDNLFNNLALTEQKKSHRKYFSLGLVVNLSQEHKIEPIFQAIKTCSEIIANLQLIIIGDGQERKSLAWLAKKMQIDTLVWFVGEQINLKKWLDNLDIYLIAAANPTLDDFFNTLEALSAGLPIIGPRNCGLDEMVMDNKNGCLIDIGNSEMLARQIIKLQQDKSWRLALGKNSRAQVDKFFTQDKMINQFKQIL